MDQEPGQQLRPVLRRAKELPGFLRQIEQDRAGIENTRFLPPGPSVSTIAGTLPLGLIFLKTGKCCSPLLVSTGTVS